MFAPFGLTTGIKRMFCIINDASFYNYIWGEVVSDIYINPWIELEPQPLERFDPTLVLHKDLKLLYIDESEGICGKLILSHTNRHSDSILLISNDTPEKYSSLIIKDIEYHVNGNSDVHEDISAFEELTQRFYKDAFKTALWVSKKLELKNIITVSDIEDEHDELEFWGSFPFSAKWKTFQKVLGFILVETLSADNFDHIELYAHSIKAESNATYFADSEEPS